MYYIICKTEVSQIFYDAYSIADFYNIVNLAKISKPFPRDDFFGLYSTKFCARM